MPAGRTPLLRKRFALPSEHGVWIWWLGPLAIGLAAGGRPQADFALLVLAALLTFLFHQPATIAVKAASGRRDASDLGPALVWCALYGSAAAACVALLVLAGHAEVLVLAVPGVPVFAWHLALVARREERKRVGVEVLAAGALALAAPAAYRVAGGADLYTEWSLWGLTWLQSAGAIMNVYRALEARREERGAPLRSRLWRSRASVGLHLAGFAVAAALVVTTSTPPLVAGAFLVALVHAVVTACREGAGRRPQQIGVSQLAAGLSFVVLMALAYAA
jgi:hypothetical protein